MSPNNGAVHSVCYMGEQHRGKRRDTNVTAGPLAKQGESHATKACTWSAGRTAAKRDYSALRASPLALLGAALRAFFAAARRSAERCRVNGRARLRIRLAAIVGRPY
jgi:hypothetical protein